MDSEATETEVPVEPAIPPGMRMTYPRWKIRVIGLAGWLVVAAVWYLGITDGFSKLADDLILVLGIMALASALIFSWVFHNKHLAHKREALYGGRKGAADQPIVLERDALGRKVDLDPGSREAKLLEVTTENGEKRIGPPGKGAAGWVAS